MSTGGGIGTGNSHGLEHGYTGHHAVRGFEFGYGMCDRL